MAKVIKTTYRKVIRRKVVKRRVVNSSKPSKAFARKVRAVIHKQAESKQAFASLPSTAFNSGMNNTGDQQNILPTIANGTTDNSRIGDQLRAQSLVVKGAVVYNPSIGSFGTYPNTRLAVRMLIVQPKQYGDYTSVTNGFAVWSQYLLKKGGTTSAFTGTLSDLWAPINTDAITKYYDKIMYINGPYERTAVGGYQMLGSTKFFNISVRCRNKLLKYDSSISGSLSPSNWAPVLLVGYVHMDGSAPDSVSTAITCQYDSIFTYEDM